MILERKTSSFPIESCVKSGYLTKKGLNRKNWQPRFFRLTKYSLCYYDNDLATKPKCLIPLSDVLAVDREDIKERYDSTYFLIQTKKRSYLLKGASEQIAHEWIEAFNEVLVDKPVSFLLRTNSSLGESTDSTKIDEELIREEWQKAARDKDGPLGFKEIKNLCRNLSVTSDEKTLKNKFELIDLEGKGYLNYEQFKVFLGVVMVRYDIKEIWHKFAGYRDYLTADEFATFIKDTQKEEVMMEFLHPIIAKFELRDTKEKEKEKETLDLLSFLGFSNYIKWASLVNRENVRCYQDMNQPITHYWINSCHDSPGDHFPLSLEYYSEAFKRGIKCLEVSIWDGMLVGSESSSINFSDVIKLIKKPWISPFPLVLCLQLSCGIETQKALADLIKESIGAKLVKSLGNHLEIPTLDSLLNKIILQISSLSDLGNLYTTSRSKLKSPKHVYKELFDLASISFIGNSKSIRTHPDAQFGMVSFLENFKNTIKKKPAEVLQFTKKNISMVSLKVPSDEASVLFWNAGFHIVSLNYATIDTSTWLNEGKFLQNGNCGYILKPKELLSNGSVDIPLKPIKRLTIRIISAFRIPGISAHSDHKEVINPYVKVTLQGVKSDTNLDQKTKSIYDNSFNPFWDQEFVFDLCCPSLALLLLIIVNDFSVKEKDIEIQKPDQPLAYFCLPVNCIMQGYRTVPLKSVQGKKLKQSSMLVHVTYDNI